ncbi:hypothetical protein NIES4071_81200 [Calothrix sp. NIES-4071]|nr:hypothetical protein NIES4071_81200 [Calothrix sp. NIES-4071]BAZ62390.1 hypothetical protein NIES4105_81130 [Calothrix sp. NIES-4105]
MNVLVGFTAAPTDVMDENRSTTELVNYLENRVNELKSLLNKRKQSNG